jgi:3-oxoacyl-[acyl-carrier protein] reductase
MAKCVFITGGARGIGQAIAKRFQEAGYEVIAPSRQELDLSSMDSLREYSTHHRTIEADVLINNAGENKIRAIKDLALEDWQRMVSVNLTAPFLLTQLVTPYMERKQWGRIVNISSVYSLVSRIGRAAYSATKSGLNGLTRAAALEYAEHGILVNALCPGFVDTELTRQNNSADQIEALRNQVPLKRLATTQEVANAVFFLGSELNTYLTGQVITLDGGFMAQ